MGAAAEPEESAETAAPVEAPAKPKRRLGLIIGLSVVLLAGAGGAGWYFLARTPAATDAEGAAAAPSSATPHYLALQPAFVVNLADAEAARYLQVEIEVMARSSSALDKVSDHMPRVRNALLLLLGSRRVSDLASREQKEKLQADVLAEIQAVMAAETGKPQIEAVYFNSFVMQ